MKTPPDESSRDPAGPQREALAQDQVDPAEELLLQLVADEPDLSSPVEQLADLYARRGRHDLAIACAQRAAARDSENPRLLRLLGRTLEAGGQPDSARDVYLAAVAVGANSRHPEPWLGLARLERAWGRPARAEQYARRALDVAPYSAEVYAELVRILLQDGLADRALAMLARGLQWVPGQRDLIDLRDAALAAAHSGSALEQDQEEAPPEETP
jgi:tetratricopeptide (TPR) repeat protein